MQVYKNQTLAHMPRVITAITLSGIFFSSLAHAANCNAMPTSNAQYNIVNKGSGLYLDVSGVSKENGANIHQWTKNNFSNQKFTLVKLDNDYWSIRPVHSEKSLDVWNWSKNNGGTIKQYHYHGSDIQKWKLQQNAKGGITITSKYSSKHISVADSKQGSDVYQDEDRGANTQLWFFNPVDGNCGGITLTGEAGDGEVALQWKGLPEIKALQIYYNTVSSTQGRTRLTGLNTSETNYTAKSLTNGTAYWFWLKYKTTDDIWHDSTPFSATPESINASLTTPQGFGSKTTGGKGGKKVRVSTVKDLAYELCHTQSGGVCTDNEARIIEVAGTIDFRSTEGQGWKKGCEYGTICKSPYITEKLLLLNENDTHCDGKKTFDIAYDKAADAPLLIGSNKTVVGVGSDATIKGKELRLYKVNNVVVQNLTISDVNEGLIFAGDGMLLYDVDNIWIDHNRFQRIGRHFITGGFGAVTNTTISWNDFDGNSNYSHNCNGTHYWNVFLVGKTQSITLANNWFREFSGRNPKISGDTMVHLVNNYFQHGTWHALDVHSESNSASKVLVEGNYFEDVHTPITEASTYVFATSGTPSTSVQTSCKNALGRECVGNFLSKTPAVDRFVQQNEVMNAFKNVSPSAVITPKNVNDIPTMVKNGAGPGRL